MTYIDQMMPFLIGVATGWTLARAPPTKDELTAAVDHVVVFLKLDNYIDGKKK